LQDIKSTGGQLNSGIKEALNVNIAVNSAASVLFLGEDGKPLHRPKIVGSATEGALLLMIHSWGEDFAKIKENNYKKDWDRVRVLVMLHRTSHTVSDEPVPGPTADLPLQLGQEARDGNPEAGEWQRPRLRQGPPPTLTGIMARPAG
jgi:hypothetical protein